MFVLKWIQNKSKKSTLHQSIQLREEGKDKLAKIRTTKQILAMCYFQYLEERGFLSQDKEYLYGQLLSSVKQQFEEPILIFLEMLKIFFPAGLEISSTPTHQEY